MKIVRIDFNNLSTLNALLKAMVGENCKYQYKEVNKEPEERFSDINLFIRKIADKKGWEVKQTVDWLNEIAELYPVAAFNILLREIAVWLDLKYEGHIENSDRIFVVSVLNGKILELRNKGIVKNYRNFAAFRTLEDAKFACNVLRNYLKGMFKSHEKQENKECH